MTNTILYAVIADEALRQSIQDNVSDDYALSIDGTLSELLERVKNEQPHIILCGQSFLERDQAVVLAMLKTASPISHILTIGPSRPIAMQVAALKHGARGYFDVALPMPTLNAALAGIMRGEVWVERHVVSELIDELVFVPEVTEQQRKVMGSLSSKELEVATLVSHGATNKMIAHQMAITERTVKAHLTATYQKMNMADRLSLAIFFRDLR
jgi:two-component system nitrate/nitrite response regulator NarL